MTVYEVFHAALSALPCPVSQPPGDGSSTTYAVFHEVAGQYNDCASNDPQRLTHMMQFHVFSSCQDGAHRKLFFDGLKLLRAAKVRMQDYGPDTYEADTGMHHIAATCLWQEKLKEE